jgi:hypothetical protein
MALTLVTRDSREGLADQQFYMHLIIPGRWKDHPPAQHEQLAQEILALDGLHLDSCVVTPTGQIYVLISIEASEEKRVATLRAILQFLSDKGIHNPEEGLDSHVPGLQ